MAKRKASGVTESPKLLKTQSNKTKTPKKESLQAEKPDIKKKTLKRNSSEPQALVVNQKKLKTAGKIENKINKQAAKYSIKRKLEEMLPEESVSKSKSKRSKAIKLTKNSTPTTDKVEGLDPKEAEEIDAFCDDIEDVEANKTFDEWVKKLDEVLLNTSN